jgi:uncharacterized protein (TIGR02271 family)
MKQLISAMVDDYEAATKAVERLKSAGIPSDDISLVGGNQQMRSGSASLSDSDEGSAAGTGAATGAVVGGGAGLLAGLGLLAIPGLGPVVAAGWLASTLAGAAVGTAAGGLIGGLTEWGMSEEEAHGYAEGVRRGGTLVTARVDDAQVDTAVQILDAEGTVDMNERTEGWRREGWQGSFGAASAGADSLAGAAGGRPVTESQPRAMPQSGTSGTEGSIPIVEEQLNVGKRKVTSGRVRVHTRVTSQPTEATVRLHDEKVRIERTPVNQPMTGAGTMPQDRTIEEIETREEPVVEKSGRVVEEVRVTKQGQDHTETIRDNVKKTDVEVEDTRGTETDKTRGRKT